ncbi:hypothetical protein TVAG_344270 [Trichomonas vaginalis G3]|uniref:Uncharacterized protein n=1 Tax=Trichomonas vaginalis (strain ATCC PRA-98 / G3) TaxID=412133 RepID=A2E7P8_TRIV3|nr:hypothetical protein TVAGG3_0598600 [Trichomonas vaginalis G3]EAY11333.1 hypothetical protein TVAG_344270 [Trichomonas vaginalis G3]KAI5523776.1 hypothetical protein TVAGG3_0598600 [Trichomonas vaginalis G3]|eukprot:XP_001323556.1 hypothetical protein [Trichomonas vaginalis G3]
MSIASETKTFIQNYIKTTVNGSSLNLFYYDEATIIRLDSRGESVGIYKEKKEIVTIPNTSRISLMSAHESPSGDQSILVLKGKMVIGEISYLYVQNLEIKKENGRFKILKDSLVTLEATEFGSNNFIIDQTKRENRPRREEQPKKEEAPKAEEKPKKEEKPKREEKPKKEDKPKKEEKPKKDEKPAKKPDFSEWHPGKN